jgi:hypothetical protein
MIRVLRSRLSKADREHGYAMVMVIAMATVMMILMAAAVATSVSGLKKSDTDQDSSAALAAAYAGVDEYQSRLTSDNGYSRWGNPLSTFTHDTISTVDVPLVGSENAAFGVGASGTWATVPGSSGAATFRYEVDNSDYATTGILRLRSTGRVGNSTRTVVANLKAKGFIDYLYFTNYEVMDPALDLDSSGNPKCQNLKYAWASGPARTGCTEITFDRNDKVSGAVHSNDTIHICQAWFTKQVTSANPNPPFYSHTFGGTNSSSGCGTTRLDGGAANVDTVSMPAKNSEMPKQTRVDSANDVPRPGCQFTGPTSIVFNAGGTMTVRSPWTRFAHAGTTTVAAGVAVPVCGTPGPGTNTLGSATGQTIPVPDNNLIFVQNVPDVASDNNYWAPGALPLGGYACKGADGSTTGNGIGYPSKYVYGGRTRSEDAPISAYDCRNGDAFVEGQLQGRVTVASANYIYITDDLTYANQTATVRGTDMLGLVGDKAVWVYNPVDVNGRLMYQDTTGRYIDAAILSVENTFQVQNYDVSPSRGNLNIFGSIAQNFRGVVSQAGGYVKAYSYDDLFASTAPPKFLGPVATTYGITATAEVSDAFAADGTAIP